MGYDLHITRAKSWAENEGFEISSDEWLKVVHIDGDLKLENANGPFCALWNGKSEHREPWLDWESGNIYSKNPDPPLIEKMISIAKRLNAKVQGDDGEIYLTPDEYIYEE